MIDLKTILLNALVNEWKVNHLCDDCTAYIRDACYLVTGQYSYFLASFFSCHLGQCTSHPFKISQNGAHRYVKGGIYFV